jgi:hypothetical protein
MNIVENKVKIDVNETCELSQDSYYTRNPQDNKVKRNIGPNSPKDIFVRAIELIKYEDKTDGDVWYSAKVEHDSIWVLLELKSITKMLLMTSIKFLLRANLIIIQDGLINMKMLLKIKQSIEA